MKLGRPQAVRLVIGSAIAGSDTLNRLTSLPMPLNIPQDYGNAQFVYQVTGITRPMTWALGFKNEASEPAQACATFIRVIMEGNAMAAAGNMGNKWTFVKVLATTNSLAGLVTGESPSNRAGTSSAGRPPCNGAVLVRKVTGLGGRTRRGRLFHPVTFLDEAAIDEAGNIAGASVTTVQGWFDSLRTAMETAGFPIYLLHENPAATPTLVSNLLVQGQLATQRRRMRS